AMDIAAAVEGAGGTINAYTSKELTCYWNHLPAERLELAIDVLADMLTASLLDPQEIDRERSVVQQEIRRTRDQPGAWVGELLGRALFGDTPMGWPTAGNEATVAALSRNDFLHWLRTWYRPQNVVLSVAGNAGHEEVLAAARRYLLEGEPQPLPAVVPVDSNLPAQRLALEERDITQANLALGLPSLSRRDPDRYALLVLNSILGRGMSSRLFKEVRERRGLAYSIGSMVHRYSDTGVLAIAAGVSPDQLGEAVRVILAEVRKLALEPPGDEELARARDYTIGTFRLSLETPMALAQRAGELLLTMGEIERIDEAVEKMRAVGIQDTQRVAQRVLQLQKATLAVVGPGLSEAELSELLEA
ncbi:MAG TPA: pitrilysin family protein, partial [Dehalococcoidia bacterium]|nr:pitrilysin family protein [Dehalococcoidia bacterium]